MCDKIRDDQLSASASCLRNFLAELFAKERDYYAEKEKSRAVNAELRMLNKLYDAAAAARVCV